MSVSVQLVSLVAIGRVDPVASVEQVRPVSAGKVIIAATATGAHRRHANKAWSPPPARPATITALESALCNGLINEYQNAA